MSIIMAIIAAVSAIAGISANAITSAQQRKHDESMANLQMENQKQLMQYETELGQDTNTIATQKGHAAAAGFSPALLYGNMTTPSLVSPSGSASGAASSLPNLNMFDKVSMRDAVEPVLQKRYQDSQIQLMASEQSLNHQRELESAMRTAEQSRYTNLQKTLEKTIIDQSLAQLEYTRAASESTRFYTRRGEALLPGELVQQGLINQETGARIEKIHTEVVNNRAELSRIYADVRRINSVTSLNASQESLNQSDSLRIQEQIKSSAVGRIMQEFGLTTRSLQPELRSASGLHKGLFTTQMTAAAIELKSLGFSEHEAVNAVLYYVAKDPKDVTPSLVNGATRIFSAAIAKK